MMRAALVLAVFLSAAAAFAHPSVGVVMDAQGNVFYSDLAQVWQISPQGRKTLAVANVHTHELALDAAGNLYGEHLWYEGDATKKWGHSIWKRTPAGVVERGPAREGFLSNYSFVRDASGAMYWADRGKRTAIRKRTPDGRITTVVSHPFKDVRWMTSTPDGTLYFADDHDLVRIDRSGRVSVIARDLPQMIRPRLQTGDRHALMGLWTSPDGSVYVACHSSGLVKKVSRDGRVTVAARSAKPWAPTGGLVAPNGDLWILEWAGREVRVRRIGREKLN